MQQESVPESPQERREFLTSLPNLSDNVFRLLHYILLHLIVVTICFRQTTLNPGCIVSHPVVGQVRGFARDNNASRDLTHF